jgi:hypothetical protein
VKFRSQNIFKEFGTDEERNATFSRLLAIKFDIKSVDWCWIEHIESNWAKNWRWVGYNE